MSQTHEGFTNLERTYRANPLVTGLAFWDTNANAEGIPRVWEDPEQGLKHMGNAMAYFTGALSMGHLHEFDKLHPPDLSVTITDTPEGKAPQSVRDNIVGLRTIGRTSLQTVEGQVRLHPPDFLMALHNEGLVSEATWYREHMNSELRKGQQVEVWSFNDTEVDVRDRTDRKLPSWHGYITPSNLTLLRFFEEGFYRLVPPFLDPISLGYLMNKGEQEKALAKLQTQADEHGNGHLAFEIQSLMWSRLWKLFEGAKKRLTDDYNDAVTQGTVYRYDDAGNPTYGSLHGTVVLDTEKGIDRRGEPIYHGMFLPLTADEAARRLHLSQVKVPALDRINSNETDEWWSWHVSRTWFGL